MPRRIPINLAGATLFMEGADEDFATGDITLPTLTPTTTSVSGAGILGNLDIPNAGHYDSIQVGIAWKTINKDAFRLVSSSSKKFEIRAAFKEFDRTAGAMVTRAVKIVISGFGKGIDLGTLAQNSETGTSNTVEVSYIKIFVDGESVFELDKLSYISKTNGVDDQEDVRKALGLA